MKTGLKLMGLALLAGAGAFFGEVAMAQEHGAVAGGSDAVLQWLALGGALAVGIAAFGCSLGQGKMVASAMEGIGRNPQSADKLFVPMILGLAFIEALGIYALVYVILFKNLVL